MLPHKLCDYIHCCVILASNFRGSDQGLRKFRDMKILHISSNVRMVQEYRTSDMVLAMSLLTLPSLAAGGDIDNGQATALSSTPDNRCRIFSMVA